MTTQIQFTALYGTGPYDPHCYLLEIDDCRILLDCGQDYCFSDKDIAFLKRIGDIDLVLISHSTIQHLGALPYAYAKLGLACPIYATIPTHRMGTMFLYDAYQNIIRKNTDFQHFTIDDVDAVLNLFVNLKYSQDVRLTDRGKGITLTPFAAGNTLGATVQRISKETEDIFYAVDFNHKRERHLNGTVLESFSRPAILICDSLNSEIQHSFRKTRDLKLLDTVTSCLSKEGNVLMPVDTAGRCLELLLILHQHQTNNQLATKYSLIFLSNTSKHVIDFANSMIEWTSDVCQKAFDSERSTPFAFENLRICTSISDLNSLPKPQLVLATNPFMESDFSQELFIEWSANPKNLILFTQRCPEYTLAGKLMSDMNCKSVIFHTTSIVDLFGAELEEYWQMEREKEFERRQALYADKSDSDSDFENRITTTTTGQMIVIEDQDSDYLDDYDKEQCKNSGKSLRNRGNKNLSNQKAHLNSSLNKSCLSEPHTPAFKSKTVYQLYPMFVADESRTANQDDYGQLVDYEKHFKIGESDSSDDDIVIDSIDSWGMKKKKKENAYSSKHQSEKFDEDGDILIDKTGPPPRKTISKTMNLNVRCKLEYIDFEGRSDGKSIKTIIGHVLPRKIILVHGSRKSSQKLRRYCIDENICSNVVVPRQNQCVDITSNSSIYKIIVRDSFYSSIDFKKINNNYEVAQIDGMVIDSSSYSDILMLDSAPTKKIQGHPSLLLGDVKLLDVKNALYDRGISAEFVRGILVCGSEGSIQIHKTSATNLSLRGSLSEDYFRIREILYSNFKIV